MPSSDVVASAEYKLELAKVITKKAVSQAAEQARF
jgi:CO/xanthine dehydrogenase FAD-binding subunit